MLHWKWKGVPQLTVRQIVESYAQGQISVTEAERRLGRATWSGAPNYTRTQRAGLVDVPAPPDNSPDWIQLVPGIADEVRGRFTGIYDAR